MRVTCCRIRDTGPYLIAGLDSVVQPRERLFQEAGDAVLWERPWARYLTCFNHPVLNSQTCMLTGAGPNNTDTGRDTPRTCRTSYACEQLVDQLQPSQHPSSMSLFRVVDTLHRINCQDRKRTVAGTANCPT